MVAIVKMENKFINELQSYTYLKVAQSDTAEEDYFVIEEENFISYVEQFKENAFSLVSMVCVENFESFKGIAILYCFEHKNYKNLFSIIVPLAENSTVSIAHLYPSASWYEREITDGFGTTFINSFDTRKLFLHDMYPADFHPLRKSFTNKSIETIKVIKPDDEYKFNVIEGEGVYQIPVGPVHAGIIEPGHFRFSVIGETIYNLEVRMFYKHRGVEKLAENKSPDEVLRIAETISGDETVSNGVAYCMAIEKIAKLSLPIRAWQLRTILMELERIYMFLSDLAGMIIDVAYSVGATDLFILREEIFRHNKELTGSRFMKNILAIGGLQKDISNESLYELSNYLIGFVKRFKEAIKSVLGMTTVIDRFVTTGIVKESLVEPLHLTGPIARAVKNLKIDERIKHPYGYYKDKELNIITETDGDVLARFNLKQNEVLESAKLIQTIVENLQDGNYNIPTPKISNGFASIVVEAPRGQNFHFVYVKNGKIDRYKVRTSSFCNWQAIQLAVIGNIVPDFPLINKSFNMTYAGTDL